MLQRLPTELLCGIASFLHEAADVTALSRTNSLIHDALEHDTTGMAWRGVVDHRAAPDIVRYALMPPVHLKDFMVRLSERRKLNASLEAFQVWQAERHQKSVELWQAEYQWGAFIAPRYPWFRYRSSFLDFVPVHLSGDALLQNTSYLADVRPRSSSLISLSPQTVDAFIVGQQKQNRREALKCLSRVISVRLLHEKERSRWHNDSGLWAIYPNLRPRVIWVDCPAQRALKLLQC